MSRGFLRNLTLSSHDCRICVPPIADFTEESVIDDMHLANATAWAMVNEAEPRDVVKHFYKSIFTGKSRGVPCYERPADIHWEPRNGMLSHVGIGPRRR